VKNNNEILIDRLGRFNHTRIGPRVGDYLFIPSLDPRIPEYTRFTHDWNDHIQTGGSPGGSYYLTEAGRLSYSGSLDPGIDKMHLICTGQYKRGDVWFFDSDIPGAGRGVTFASEMVIYTTWNNADISGLHHLNCPYYLTVLDAQAHIQTCGYWYTITKNGTSHTAFKTQRELCEWMSITDLYLTRPLANLGNLSGQTLSYTPTEIDPARR